MNLIKFFKKNYALQNMKKSKGILAIMLIVIPVITTFCLYAHDSSRYVNPYEIFVAGGANFFGMIIIPFILSNVLFGYVYKRNSIDFINSMPINRKNLYFTNIVVGILYILILQVITFLFASIYIVSVGDSLFSIKLMFDIALAMSLAYAFLYICSTLALTVSGNRFIQLVVLIIVLFTIPFVRMTNLGSFIQNSKSIFLVNDNGIATEHFIDEEHVFAMPLTTFISFVGEDRVLEPKSALLTLGLAVLYTIIGYKLFEKRKMENTGNSFESEKLHLLVKGITLYPVWVVLYQIYDELEIPQLLLIMFVVFVYYFVYDLITIKKIKFKTTCVAFVVTSVVLLLTTMGLTKVGELTNEQKEYYYANEINSMEIRLSELFYGNMSYGEIKDENLNKLILSQITKNDYTRHGYGGSVAVDVSKVDSYVKNYSISVKCNFNNNEDIKISGTIDKDTYIQLLNYVLNDEEYINGLVEEWKISKDAMLEIVDGTSDKVFVGKEAERIKEVINKNLHEHLKEKISQELNSIENGSNYKMDYYDYNYYAVDNIEIYEYEDFEVKNYNVSFDVRSEVAQVIYDELNKAALEISEEYLKDIDGEDEFDYRYETNGRIARFNNDSYVEYANIYDADIRLIKEYIEKVKDIEFDVTKEFYQIDLYSMDCILFVNSIEEFERTIPGVTKDYNDDTYRYSDINTDVNSLNY
ncbi:MAG: hypothetical protein IKJ36_05610 [Clostridia bacterium]|nr:hypothetical protein [Clostridia bacterium]